MQLSAEWKWPYNYKSDLRNWLHPLHCVTSRFGSALIHIFSCHDSLNNMKKFVTHSTRSGNAVQSKCLTTKTLQKSFANLEIEGKHLQLRMNEFCCNGLCSLISYYWSYNGSRVPCPRLDGGKQTKVRQSCWKIVWLPYTCSSGITLNLSQNKVLTLFLTEIFMFTDGQKVNATFSYDITATNKPSMV